MSRLDDRVVVVTGAARGMGAAEVDLLADRGATVIAADVLPFVGPERVGVTYCRLDVTRPSDWQQLARLVRERFGVVHGLVNNAGRIRRGTLLDVTPEEIADLMSVNVIGPVLGMQTMAPLMPRGGSIVNICSVAAMVGSTRAAYTASKWALRGLTKTASVELGYLGLRVNAVHPGFIETDMTEAAGPEYRDVAIRETTLGRSGQPIDVAMVVAFLLSEDSGYVSGVDIPVDGGHAGHGGVKAISDLLRSQQADSRMPG